MKPYTKSAAAEPPRAIVRYGMAHMDAVATRVAQTPDDRILVQASDTIAKLIGGVPSAGEHRDLLMKATGLLMAAMTNHVERHGFEVETVDKKGAS